MSKKIAITFCGGVEEVTGANYLLELSDGDVTHRMLVDCGLTQGSASMEEKNRRPFSYDPKTIDLLLITHAHIDHIGRVPKLVHDGFHGRIVSTPETKELAEPMLLDALKIADEEARRKGILALYEKADLERSLELWDGLSYGTSRELAPGVFVTPRDAGHVLGSAMFEFALDGAIYGDGEGKHQPVRLVFTGDLGNSPSPLLRDTETIRGAHYLVMESVYGDRNHESVEDRRELLKDVVLKTVKKNGTLLVPIFSLEKTQVLL
ncbi:MAG: MBL fold metallo-hydrolase, partial [Candidatus Taylorbacteria bacterium]|nr:MBL fold metallo-hydrolase [Candidatus Taylorbacteria bacterium]